MTDKYILDGRRVVPCTNSEAWGRWYGKADRHVAISTIGDVTISTVFLGIDHSFGHGGPILFETMIFGGEHDQYQTRCSTWEEAEKEHAEAVALVTVAASP